jgi:hypothetical protein
MLQLVNKKRPLFIMQKRDYSIRVSRSPVAAKAPIWPAHYTAGLTFDDASRIYNVMNTDA